ARARATVLRLIRRKPASCRTVGSCIPGLSPPVLIRCRIWVPSCTCTGTALFLLTRSPDGGRMTDDSRATPTTCPHAVTRLGWAVRRGADYLSSRGNSARLGGSSRRAARHPVTGSDQGQAQRQAHRSARRRDHPDHRALGGQLSRLVQAFPR